MFKSLSQVFYVNKNCFSVYRFFIFQSIFKLNKYRRAILNNHFGRYRSMQDVVPSQQHLMGLNDRNYQWYSRVEQEMLPPQESTVIHNYYSGPSAPYVPQVFQQNVSEAVIQQTSCIAFQYSFARQFG